MFSHTINVALIVTTLFIIFKQNLYHLYSKNKKKVIYLYKHFVLILCTNHYQYRRLIISKMLYMKHCQHWIVSIKAYPGSSVPKRSQIKLTNTDDGPLTPSLSSIRFKVKFFVPGGISTGLSRSFRRKVIDPPGRGSPCTCTSPIVEPICRDSDTKNVSEEEPVSR